MISSYECACYFLLIYFFLKYTLCQDKRIVMLARGHDKTLHVPYRVLQIVSYLSLIAPILSPCRYRYRYLSL